jgi:hypothetical protein
MSWSSTVHPLPLAVRREGTDLVGRPVPFNGEIAATAGTVVPAFNHPSRVIGVKVELPPVRLDVIGGWLLRDVRVADEAELDRRSRAAVGTGNLEHPRLLC